jgi:hypothetical protein
MNGFVGVTDDDRSGNGQRHTAQGNETSKDR